MPRGLVAACFVSALPVLALAVLTARQMKRRRRRVLSTMEAVAPNAWPVAALLIAAFVVVALTGAGAPSGDPQVRDGRYVLNNHGTLTEISRDEYSRYESRTRRMYGGAIGAMYTPGIALGLYAWKRRRPRPEPAGGRRR